MNNTVKRQYPMLLILTLALGFAAGCTEKDTSPTATQTVPAAVFAERLSAAQAISDSFKRDAAAAAAALALAKAGKRGDATEVARMIRDSSKRDATLSQLANE